MSFINPFSVSFACVALAFAAGGDYVVQAKAHGSYPGGFSVGEYVETFGARLDQGKERLDKKKRQSVLARTHLPEAGEGWERAVWAVEDVDIGAVIAGMDILGKSSAKEQFRSARLIAQEDVWEYRRGSEWVRIFVRYSDEPFVTKTLVSSWLTERFEPVRKPQYKPYAVVQGVPVMKIESGKARETNRPLMLEAHLGEEIRIAVAASATRESVLDLLGRVDFDNLNLMLDASFDSVGQAAPVLTDAQAIALSRLHAEARNAKTPLSLAEVNARTIQQTAALTETGPAPEQATPEVAPQPAPAEVREIQGTGGTIRTGGKASRLKLSGGGLVQVTK